MSKIEVETKDGTCPSHVYRPTGRGPWPAVLVFMDGLGIRPAPTMLPPPNVTGGRLSRCSTRSSKASLTPDGARAKRFLLAVIV